MGLVKPITLEIDSEIWDKFKEITPRTITLNEALIDLIKQKIKKKVNNPVNNFQV